MLSAAESSRLRLAEARTNGWSRITLLAMCGATAERPAFSRWRDACRGGTPPTGTRVTVGCNGMLDAPVLFE